MHTITYACVSVAVGNTVSTGHCLHRSFIFNVSVKIFYSPSLFVSEWIVTFFMICELIIAYLTACNDYAVCIPWMVLMGRTFTELTALWMVFSALASLFFRG